MKKTIAGLALAITLPLLGVGCGCGKGQPAGSCYSQIQPPVSAVR